MARHRVQVLRAAGKTLKQIVAEAGVSQSSVQRIGRERAIEAPANLLQAAERGRAVARVGRSRKSLSL